MNKKPDQTTGTDTLHKVEKLYIIWIEKIC